MVLFGRLFRRLAGRRRRVVRLPDGTQVVLPREFGRLTTAELAGHGIVPGMGEPSRAFVVRRRRSGPGS
jgi:hypothetical protein